jgi:GDP-L-fucose synthase
VTNSSFYRGKKVLVTGGAGFVGSHIVEELQREGAQVRVTVYRKPFSLGDAAAETIPADLSKLEDCRRAARGVQFVFHAAGAVAAAGTGPADAMAAITLNLVLTSQMLQAAWNEGVERFLVFGSSTGYPVADHPVREEEMWSAPPYPGYFGYAWMRRYIERLAEFVAQKSPMRVAILRPTAVYGPRDNFDPASSHVIPALISRASKKENPFVVWGTGDEIRDFLHVTDLARGCLLLLEKRADCDPVNIAYGKPVTIKQVVRSVLRATNHTAAELKFDASKPTAIPVRMVDISKAQQILGFEARMALDEGILDTVRWYQRQRLSGTA